MHGYISVLKFGTRSKQVSELTCAFFGVQVFEQLKHVSRNVGQPAASFSINNAHFATIVGYIGGIDQLPTVFMELINQIKALLLTYDSNCLIL